MSEESTLNNSTLLGGCPSSGGAAELMTRREALHITSTSPALFLEILILGGNGGFGFCMGWGAQTFRGGGGGGV